ncbi:MAG: hypothetical protein R3C53_22655 [Pirellulaceae bacterium]
MASALDAARTAKPQSKSVLRKGLVETLEKRELLNADWNPTLLAHTGLFVDAAARGAAVTYVNARAGGGSGGASSGSGGQSPEGGPTDIINLAEVEP